jgi:ABC-type transporter Mla MlaB component
MLKVTVFSGGAECRITVERTLFSPWASELESAWEPAQQAASGKTIAVDISGMTIIDSNGKAIRIDMIGQRAKLVARGVHNEHIVEKLKSKARTITRLRIIRSVL